MSGETHKPVAIGPRVVVRWTRSIDPDRARRVALLVQNIVDTAGTPDEAARK